MDFEKMAAAMYPALQTAAAPAAQSAGSTPQEKAPEAAPAEQQRTEQQPAVGDAMFGGGGEPMEDYNSVLGYVFDSSETEARGNQDEALLAELEGARKGLNETMIEFGLGDSDAREIMNSFQERVHYPWSRETSEKKYDEGLAALQKKWGDKTDAMLKGAGRVLDEAAKRVPRLLEALDATGYVNDAKFVEKLVKVAKRRGWV
jgi:hypothetical protein